MVVSIFTVSPRIFPAACRFDQFDLLLISHRTTLHRYFGPERNSQSTSPYSILTFVLSPLSQIWSRLSGFRRMKFKLGKLHSFGKSNLVAQPLNFRQRDDFRAHSGYCVTINFKFCTALMSHFIG